MTANDVEPTLAHTQVAADSVRAANHAAYGAPRNDTSNVYDRTGAVRELLSYAEQLVRVLGEDAARLSQTSGLSATGSADAEMHAQWAAADLIEAAGKLHVAADMVNAAWSYLSPLYITVEGGDG